MAGTPGTTKTTVVPSTALSYNPEATKEILDILGTLPSGQFIDTLINMLTDTNNAFSSAQYLAIIKALGKTRRGTETNTIVDFLFDLMTDNTDVPFVTDIHFYSVVANSLSELIDANDAKKLRNAILARLTDSELDLDIKVLLNILEEL